MTQFQIIDNIRLKIAVEKFIELLISGKTIEAIDEFYDDSIIQIENNGDPIFGKQQLRSLEEDNLKKVNSFNTTINDLVIDEQKGLVLGEMIINFETHDQKKKRLSEAFIQHWKNEKIIRQQFYYSGIHEVI